MLWHGAARKLRVEYAGAIYHVTVRSNGGSQLFCGDSDRRYLLERIAQAAEMHRVRVYQTFVEAGVATGDEEFRAAMARSVH